MTGNSILEKIRGKLIVSCQGNASDGNPFNLPEHMLIMADAAAAGGCVGFRANTPPNVKIIKDKYPQMPMVGIWKVVTEGYDVYITPTMQEVDKLRELGCEIIAVDGTDRINREGRKAYELIADIKKKYPDQLVMADLATLQEAECCVARGVDIISTTLSGYTANTLDRYPLGADFDLIRDIRKKFPNAFINAEGRIWTPEEMEKAFECGADVVTIGTAVTNPMAITKRFVSHLK